MCDEMFFGNSVKWTESHVTSSSFASENFFDARVNFRSFFSLFIRFTSFCAFRASVRTTKQSNQRAAIVYVANGHIFYLLLFSTRFAHAHKLILMLLGSISEMNPGCLVTNIPNIYKYDVC